MLKRVSISRLKHGPETVLFIMSIEISRAIRGEFI